MNKNYYIVINESICEGIPKDDIYSSDIIRVFKQYNLKGRNIEYNGRTTYWKFEIYDTKDEDLTLFLLDQSSHIISIK